MSNLPTVAEAVQQLKDGKTIRGSELTTLNTVYLKLLEYADDHNTKPDRDIQALVHAILVEHHKADEDTMRDLIDQALAQPG